MGVTVEKDKFADRDQAIAEIEARGLFASDRAIAVGDLEDIHWHETGLVLYVLSGVCETKDGASGEVMVARHGDVIAIPPRTLHAARCPEPATFVVGFESEQALREFGPKTPDELG